MYGLCYALRRKIPTRPGGPQVYFYLTRQQSHPTTTTTTLFFGGLVPSHKHHHHVEASSHPTLYKSMFRSFAIPYTPQHYFLGSAHIPHTTRAIYLKEASHGRMVWKRALSTVSSTVSKEVVIEHNLPPDISVANTFYAVLTNVQKSDIKKLKESDPKTWTKEKLAHKFGTSPLLIEKFAPTPAKYLVEEIERKDQLKKNLLEATMKRRKDKRAILEAWYRGQVSKIDEHRQTRKKWKTDSNKDMQLGDAPLFRKRVRTRLLVALKIQEKMKNERRKKLKAMATETEEGAAKKKKKKQKR